MKCHQIQQIKRKSTNKDLLKQNSSNIFYPKLRFKRNKYKYFGIIFTGIYCKKKRKEKHLKKK